jgi:hypothetical protein
MDFAKAGNQYNYVSTYLYLGSDFDTARDWAAHQIANGATYAFATGPSDEGIAKGYLFADADGNGTMDTGIELLGGRLLHLQLPQYRLTTNGAPNRVSRGTACFKTRPVRQGRGLSLLRPR